MSREYPVSTAFTIGEQAEACMEGEMTSTCDRAGGLKLGAAIRLAVMPGNGLRLPVLPCEIPPGNRKPSELYRDVPTNEGICGGGAGDAAGD